MNFVLILAICTVTIPGKPVDLTGIKCVVSGKPATTKYSSNYLKGKIYLDSRSSQLKFESEQKKYQFKANHQLVITGQYQQYQCPVSQKPLPPKTRNETAIMGVKVWFCCQTCASNFAGKKDSKINALFSPSQFGKVFHAVSDKVVARTSSR